MKIAFDSWVLSSRFRYHGTYVYARSLISEFQQLAQLRPELQFCLFTAPRNSNDAHLVATNARFDLIPARLLGHKNLWRLGGISRAAARAQADLIFSPTLSSFPIGGVPIVCTVHDATPVTMPSHSTRVTMLQRALLWAASRRARAIITVSECSRRDLVERCGVPEANVHVVYNGYDKATFTDAAPDPKAQKNLLAKLGVHRPYILHHGIIQPRKNLKRLIEAFRLMLSRNPSLEFDLILAGSLGWAYDKIVAAADAPGNSGRVVLSGALEGSELALLIKGASLVVIPSLYEGFCLPMVEAMACGAPVIASGNSCLPEISGGVLKYFDPYSIEEIDGCMQQVLEDREMRMRLAREGKKRASFFDWGRCAEQTLAVLCGAAGGSSQETYLNAGT